MLVNDSVLSSFTHATCPAKDVYEKEHKIPNPNPNSLKSKW